MLNDSDGRLALAHEHADELRRQVAAAQRAGQERVRLRWRLGRFIVAAGLRLTREEPLTWPEQPVRPSIETDGPGPRMIPVPGSARRRAGTTRTRPPPPPSPVGADAPARLAEAETATPGEP
jgi:hypothetical protein